MTPTWLQRARGDATRAVQLRLCPRCHAPTLLGLDADLCALLARVDPTPLNETGEAIALLAGRRTYDLIGNGQRKELHHRAPWNIRASRRYLVFPDHRCHQSLDAHCIPTPERSKKARSTIPPF